MDLVELGTIAKGDQAYAYFGPNKTMVRYKNKDQRARHLLSLQRQQHPDAYNKTVSTLTPEQRERWVEKAQSKRRKDKNGRPVGRGDFAGLQSAAARGAEIEIVPPARTASRGRLIRTITPKRLALAAIPLSAAGAGYAYYRRNNKTENPVLAHAQMRQISSKM